MLGTARVSEQSHETIVIAASEELSVVRSTNTVDVSAISSLGVNSLNVPAKFDSGGSPDNWFGVGLSRWILLAVVQGPE